MRFGISLLASSFLGGAALSLHSASSGLPTVEINLDLPPKERWVKLVQSADGKASVKSMTASCPTMKEMMGPKDTAEWVKHNNFPAEYIEELQGIVDALPDVPHLSLDCLILINLLYDLQIGLPGSHMCSAILAAQPDGTVLHGRLADFANPDQILWTGLYDGTFIRNGKPFYKSVVNIPLVGLDTALRFDGWSVQQNTREVGISEKIDLEAAKRGGKSAFIEARKIMEEVPDFATAVNRFATTRWMSPQYWILAGSGKYEGAVVTVDKTPEDGRTTIGDVETLNPYTRWFLAQTNTDRWVETNPEGNAALFWGKEGVGHDDRFDQALGALSKTDRSKVNAKWVQDLMTTPPMYNEGNIFYTTMIPATSEFQVVVPPAYYKFPHHNTQNISLLSSRRKLKV